MEKKIKKNDRLSFSEAIKSPFSIIIVLILFVVAELIYTRYLIKADKLYSYYGYDDDFSVLGGTIFEGRTVNNFGDSKILYTGDDIILYDFEAGYYIKMDEEEYKPLSIATSYDMDEERGASLKELLAKTSFAFTETHKGAKFLSKENMENLDKLVFKIEGEDAGGKKIEIIVPLTTEKLTK